MADKHYNLEEALEIQGGVWNQTYDLKIVNVGETKEYDKRDGSGKFKVQALQVTDGTAELKWSVFNPDRIFTEGMGVHLEKVYIVEKGGYTDLKVAKAGADLIKYSEDSSVTMQPKTEKKKEDFSTDEVRHILDEIFCILKRIEKKLGEQ